MSNLTSGKLTLKIKKMSAKSTAKNTFNFALLPPTTDVEWYNYRPKMVWNNKKKTWKLRLETWQEWARFIVTMTGKPAPRSYWISSHAIAKKDAASTCGWLAWRAVLYANAVVDNHVKMYQRFAWIARMMRRKFLNIKTKILDLCYHDF